MVFCFIHDRDARACWGRCYLLVLIILFCSCNSQKKDNSNIKITNNDFKKLLADFSKSPHISESDRTGMLSVSVTLEPKDTIIGIHANKFLLFKYYIGCIQTDSTTMYFYADNKKNIQGLYDVVSKPKIMADSIYYDVRVLQSYKETYNKGYYYRNGNFILQNAWADKE